MCGIAGLVQSANQPISVAAFKSALDIVAHRGPNDEGYSFWGAVQGVDSLPKGKGRFFPKATNDFHLAFGHRRLSILDLSERGHQPMSSITGDTWVVHNGEVYNYRELRTELETLGWTFNSGTDTEVILAAYRQWGTDAFNRFNGMWAFALWDFTNQKLILCRDRFGVKPLYYAQDSNAGMFAFGSEIKQLRQQGLGTGRVQKDMACRYLLNGQSDDTRETLFEGIFRLLPGEFLEWDLSHATHSYSIRKFYELPFQTTSLSREQWVKGFEELLTDSVRLRLRADVPAGSCLSGGLDSSALVSLVGQLEPRVEQFTFTSSFANPRYDELKYARQVSQKIGTREHLVHPDLDRLWEQDLDRLLWHQDEPFTSTSIYAQWKVMEAAGMSGVKVLLDGQGGDELLGGYHRYIPIHLASLLFGGRWGTLKGQIQSMNETGLLQIVDSPARLMANTIAKGLGIYNWRRRGLRSLFHKLPPPEASKSDSRLELMEHLRFDFVHSLQMLLRYEDRNSMAHSIEARTPFLDYRLVEWVMSGRAEWLFEGGRTKSPLREMTENLLPDGVRLRMDKMGFVTPETEWNQVHESQLKDRLLAPQSHLWFWMDQEKLRRLVEKQGLGGLGFAPWRWLIFDRWVANQKLTI